MAPPFSRVLQPKALGSSLTPLLSHFTRNPSASPVDFCSETDLEYAQFSPPRCHTAISGLDDGSGLLPAPPASAQPQAPLQPLLPSQTQASNWTKVRSGPLPGTLLRLPPKSSQWPTGPCLTWTPVPLGCIAWRPPLAQCSGTAASAPALTGEDAPPPGTCTCWSRAGNTLLPLLWEYKLCTAFCRTIGRIYKNCICP